MQGSFEKKVQEKLDELKLTPSAPVWEKVALQIQPEKKRRRSFFWIPFVLLLLTGGVFYYASIRKEVPADDRAILFENTPNIEKNTAAETLPLGLNMKKREEKKETEERETFQDKPVANPVNGLEMNVEFLPAPENPFIHRNKRSAVLESSRADAKPEEKNTTPANAGQPEVPVTADVVPLPEKNATAVSEDKLPLQNRFSTENKQSSLDSIVKEERKEAPLTTDTVNAKRKIASLQSKWRKMFLLEIGWNRPATGLFSTAVADLYASPSTGANNPPQPNYSSQSSGRVSGGHSFSIGAGLTRALSPHIEIAFGLQYSFHRLHTTVGSFQRIDTAFALSNRSTVVQGYYRNGSSIPYNINQHLLELPLSINYKPLAKLPLSLVIGASYGRLLHSNMLTYNSRSNAYYSAPGNNRKNHLSVFSMLQFGLINRPAFQLHLGPVLRYHLTSLQQQTSGAPMRLSFAGLSSSISF